MTNSHDDYESLDSEPKSKTQLKKEMHELQEYAETLLSFSKKRLASLPLSQEILDALEEAKRIKSREALRRHRQFLGKLMRAADYDAIVEGIDRLLSPYQGIHNAKPKTASPAAALAETLMNGGKEDFERALEDYASINRQQLRQLLRNAQKEAAAQTLQDEETSSKKTTKQLSKLIRYLDDVLGR